MKKKTNPFEIIRAMSNELADRTGQIKRVKRERRPTAAGNYHLQ